MLAAVEAPAPAPAIKRKSTGGEATPASKKARKEEEKPSKQLVNDILAAKETFVLPSDEAGTRKLVTDLAEYARSLESKEASGPAAPAKALTPEELDAAAEKVRKAAHSGIERQMKWKNSCRTGSAKFSYDGVCMDPLVFGHIMKLSGPPNFKLKKLSVAEFEDMFGSCRGSARYDTLYITSKDVTVRWPGDGTFKISGSYGKFHGNSGW